MMAQFPDRRISGRYTRATCATTRKLAAGSVDSLTPTGTLPAPLRSAAAIGARSVVALTKLVGRASPSQSTLLAALNPAPVTVSV